MLIMKHASKTFMSIDTEREEREQERRDREQGEEVNLIQPYPHELHASN